MKLFRDVVCQVVGKGQGCSLIYANVYDYTGVVAQAKGKSAPVQNVTQSNAPWSGQQGYLQDLFFKARSQSQVPQTFFPGQTYANFSPQTEQALNLTQQRALAGSPVQNAMNQELQKTLGGDYLFGGEGFNAALQAAVDKIIPDIQSRYASGGRFASGLGRAAEAKAIADRAAEMYEKERQNQLKAMFFAPQAAAGDYSDIRALAGVGEARDVQAQNAIDEAMARHNFAQQEPWQRLLSYSNLIQGNYGGESSGTTQGFRGSRGAGILGGALGGAQLGNSIFPGTMGSGVGAALGGLLGLF